MPTNPHDKKIINAHTHVFTGNFVPPYLARTIMPWPFYYLVNTVWIINIFKRYYKNKHKKEYGYAKTKEESIKLWNNIYKGRRRERSKVKTRFFISSRWYINLPYKLIGLWLSVVAALFFVEFLAGLFTLEQETVEKIDSFKAWLSKYYLYYDLQIIFKVIWFVVVILVVKWSRTLILFILKSLFPILKKILSKNTVALIDRYILLGRFSFYEKQSRIASRALSQLPPDSSIVILPMDMEYMGAGKSKIPKEARKKEEEYLSKGWEKTDFSDSFKFQMRELWDFVKNKTKTAPKADYFPFVFIDPRRAAEEGKAFFDYTIENDRMVLKPCFLKTYMKDRGFSGFKIYPALGYYPFDEHLLPIWRYAAENNFPIMTHCIKGTIYYRGKMKKEFNYHPVFQQEYKHELYEPMLLPDAKHVDAQIHFTHPLNYLCLVEEMLLKMVISKTDANSEVRSLFGYSEADDTITHNLSNLKICMAHYGGEEEWNRYMELDRQNSSQRLMRDPKNAINFTETSGGDFSWTKINRLWDKGDWYSMICSLMIRYDNIYADLSYIISKPPIYPLLKYTLEKGADYDTEHAAYLAEPSPNKKATHYSGKNKLRSRVLFGTDFYVVRNHKSDKDLFVEAKSYLGDEDFDLIARENTFNYLARD